MNSQKSAVVLVGCGNMGRAMLEGWISSGVLAPSDAHIIEPADMLREKAADLGARIYSSATELPASLEPALIIFAVKPQVMFDVTPDYQDLVSGGAAVVSVAAGIKTERFADQFGQETSIIRVMPNTPAAVSKGMMVMFSNSNVTADQEQFVKTLMAASGEVATIDREELMDAVTAVSGSGPAYIFHMIEALRDAGIAAGLPDETAALLANQTVYGSAVYAAESGAEPGLLREQVTSPNGTTAAALDILMGDDRLKNLMQEAVMAAKKRSEELG